MEAGITPHLHFIVHICRSLLILSEIVERFIRAAEESTRPTFEAIESLTRAINSVAFMMESTFGSLNMSFQAILSVIDNFSQARAFLKQFFASILTLRIFHKFFSILINLMRTYAFQLT